MVSNKKIVNLEKSRSRRPGLLPFLDVDESGMTIIKSIETEENGNYGKYVCDINIKITQGPIGDYRIKYLDIIAKYNRIEKLLKTSVYVKKIPNINYTYNCNGDKNIECVGYKFIPYEDIDKGRYHFIPIKKDFFNEINNHYFLKELDDIYIFDITEYDRVKKIINDSDNLFFVLLDNYDDYKAIEAWWKNPYPELVSYPIFRGSEEDFKFSKDVETNILGLIEVIGTEYVSDIFPRFVYKVNIEEWKKKELSTEFNDYLDSFKFNSYNSNENGEFIFYDNHNDTVISFVSPEIEMPLLITQEMSYDSIYEPYEYSISGETKFEQIIGEDVSIDEENDRVNNGSIWMQVISGASVVSVVKDYESLNDNVISYDSDTIEKRLYNELKPKSKFINVMDIEVESKIDSLFSPNTVMLNETYLGRFLDFDENYKDSFNAFKPVSDIRSLVNTKPSGGRLFKCVYKNKNYEKLVVTNEEIETSGEVSITTSELVFSGETFPQTELSGSRVRIINLRMGDETITEEKGNFTETETSIGKITSFQQSAITRQVYSYWECVEVDNIEDFICGDGENDILPNSDTENRYRNVPILSCLENFVKNPQIDDVYYFMARHDNGLAVKSTFENDNAIAYSGAVISLPAENTESGLEYKTFTIPFDVGTPLNITTFDDGTIMCDMITSISRFYHKNENNVDEGLSEDMIGIYYAKGIYIDSETYEPILETGIHYYELLPYKPNKYAENVFIDYAIPGSIYYDEVDYFYNTKTVSFNERNDLITRNARMANIISMEVGTEWTKHTACRTLVFTKDYSSTLKDNLKMELKSEFNRGLASAWETHFKLAECNTMDDLRQYGNNYFNI